MITNGLPWFRLYAEMVDDPKVGTLDDSQFRLWVEMLCLACACGNNGDTDLTADELNWKLRRNVSGNVSVLLQRDLLAIKTHAGGRETYAIKNWMKRQFQSDVSTARVRKFRQKNNETFQKRCGNGVDTDTDTDTDTEIKKDRVGSALKTFQYPDWLNKDLWSDFSKMRSRIKKPITTERTITRLINALKAIIDKGHNQDEIIQASIDNCWWSFYAPKPAFQCKPNGKEDWI